MCIGDTLDAIKYWRPRLVAEIPGEVLEIGAGSGSNFPYYRHATHVWAIEPDAGRAMTATQAAAKAFVPVEVRVAAAEELPFDDNSFDNVVSSLVFCSVADPPRALAEIQRVLRPGGTLHMLEHVRPWPPPLAWAASAVTPIWSPLAGNCHLDRPTETLLKQHGWQIRVLRRIGIFVRMDACLPE
jgi:ubiquinone/menaquinone biosynthesis C-methylase UbiE